MTESTQLPARRETNALDFSKGLLRGLNYEMHLINHGLGAFARNHPWMGGPLALMGATLAWGLYWLLFPPLAVVTMAVWLVTRIATAVKT